MQINHLILHEFFLFSDQYSEDFSFQRSSACQQLADYQSVLDQEFAWVFDTSLELSKNKLSQCHDFLFSSQIIGVEYPHCRSNSAQRVRDAALTSVFSPAS